MKKVLYIVFAFYFLSLSLMPCNEEEGENNNVLTEQVSQAQHHDHESDVCTPFCVCSCCATHILMSSARNDFAPTQTITTIYTHPKNADVCSAIIPIWQPPKLVG